MDDSDEYVTDPLYFRDLFSVRFRPFFFFFLCGGERRRRVWVEVAEVETFLT